MSEVLRKERPKKADVWSFFTVFEGSGREIAVCKICEKCLPRKRSTWNIRDHLSTEHQNAHLLQDAEDYSSESEWFEISMDSEELKTEHEKNQTTSLTSASTASNTIETTTSTTTSNNDLNGSTSSGEIEN